MPALELQWCIHQDAVAMEAALQRIAATRPCTDCGGNGVLSGFMHCQCQHCDGTGMVPVMTARAAALAAAQALAALQTEAAPQ